MYNVQNSVFSPRSPRFVILTLGAPLFSGVQQSTRACTKQTFSARHQHVLSFSHWAHYLLPIFSKVQGFLQISVFSPRSARFVNSALSGLKLCFVQTCALCSKALKSVVPCRKMTRRADLVQETLFCTNSCILLKIAKKWCTQCQNGETSWSRAENAVFHKLVHFAENG